MVQPIESKIIEAVAKVSKRKSGDVHLDSSFEQLGMDSLDRVCLLFELEQAFDISIPEEAVQNIQTVQDIVARLGEHLGGQTTAPSPAPGGASGTPS